jgi:hypothetical protein
LGTSTAADAKIYFNDLDKHLKHFHAMQAGDKELIELAFSKKKADERKEWLRTYRVCILVISTYACGFHQQGTYFVQHGR